MLKNYLKLAWKVLWRRKFFTVISLFGISFTLVGLMVATALLDHVFAPYPPEVRQHRTLGIFRAEMTGGRSSWHSNAGYKLLDRYARDLPGVERLAITSTAEQVYSYQGGTRVKLFIRRSDAEYWRVLDYRFLEGGPFTDQDVANGSLVAVINASTRDRFFGGPPALGKTIEADGQHFRVIGVVPDVPILREVSFAELYVPVTTAKTDAYREQLLGGFTGLLLAQSPADFPAIKAEFAARLPQIPLPNPRWEKLTSRASTKFEYAAEMLAGSDGREANTALLWAFIAGVMLLFALLPTVNLVNLNMSRIMERASEIGVRKAFGASSRTLVGQFIVENVVLALIGGVLGFLGSVLVLEIANRSSLIPYAHFAMNYRIFLYGLGLAVFFGVLSGVYPAWRMSRLHPVQALKGASR
ncbi:MAG: ABC transporter permease [Acidobacteriota bacterium]